MFDLAHGMLFGVLGLLITICAYFILYSILLLLAVHILYIIPTTSYIEAGQLVHFNLLQFPVSILESS